IEVVTGDDHEFPSAARESDRIVAVALADSTGFRHVVRGDRLDEPALLEETTRILGERDPDVIEGHNIFRFDLEYLEARARRHRVRLGWGRDGSELRSRPARPSVAERPIGYRRDPGAALLRAGAAAALRLPVRRPARLGGQGRHADRSRLPRGGPRDPHPAAGATGGRRTHGDLAAGRGRSRAPRGRHLALSVA